ncbi:TRAP transporter substrate-binding protein [Streptomyces sp. NPDC001663]|uniref:TRAP transporter substrate-binding protein n=1 Tax=Streptomyces sp. NPDC001663 TaxID=3364597 RepID=UPI0036BF3979
MDAHNRRFAVPPLALALAVSLLAACQTASGSDKTGGDTTVLKLATIDAEIKTSLHGSGPQTFVDELAKVSGGRLKAEVTTDYGQRAAQAESHLVQAIAAGKVDGGWPATRAFAKAGVKGLETVEAPMTITSYAGERALVSGPLAGKYLARLKGSGVVGLGLAAGPLRRPFAAKAPLLSPADFNGIRFRVYNSPVQEEAMRALGATPVDLGYDFGDQITAGTLRGSEFDIVQYRNNGLTTEAGNITENVVLWPKVFVLSLSKKRYDSLSGQQRTWVRQAAAAAVKASTASSHDETPAAQYLCRKGARFARADGRQLAALHTAFRPVLDRLATDPADARLLHELQTLAQKHPGPEPLDLPAKCRVGDASGKTADTSPTAVASIPDGVYRAEITKADVDAAGGDVAGTHPAGIWTLTVRSGTYEVRCRPVAEPGDDCGAGDPKQPLVEAGDLRGSGDVVTFVPNAERLSKLTGCELPVSFRPDHCGLDTPYRLKWSLDDEQLVFDFIGDIGTTQSWVIKPYREIG